MFGLDDSLEYKIRIEKMLKHKNNVSCDIWNDLVIDKQNEINDLENDLHKIQETILDEYLITHKEDVEPELMEQYRTTDTELQSIKRQYTYIKLLDKWLDKVNPDNNLNKKMKIFDDLNLCVM